MLLIYGRVSDAFRNPKAEVQCLASRLVPTQASNSSLKLNREFFLFSFPMRRFSSSQSRGMSGELGPDLRNVVKARWASCRNHFELRTRT